MGRSSQSKGLMQSHEHEHEDVGQSAQASGLSAALAQQRVDSQAAFDGEHFRTM